MSSRAVLTYWRGRGRAEIIRLTMAAVGVEWDSVNMTQPEEFDALKAAGKLMFGQVPLCEFEGKNLVQSGAAARFFARRGNLYGDNDDEAVRIDMLYEGARDFIGIFMAYGFAGYEEFLEKAKSSMPRYLNVFNQELAYNGSNGFLVGNRLSLADVALLENVLLIEEYYGSSELEAYPELQKFSENMKSNEALSNYLNGPNRYPKNNPDYVADVKRTLKF